MVNLNKIITRTEKDILGEDVLDKVEIKENNEPLIDIGSICNVKIIMKPVRREYAGEDKLYAREKTVYRLKEAQEYLPEGWKFAISDAYRPLDYQKMRFESLFNKIKNENPEKDEQEIRKMTFVYVFPPNTNPKTPPAHSTGGAIDLTLINNDGNLLDMGCNIGDFNDTTTYTNSRLINNEQRNNRLLLINVMAKAGFTNYPGEWWHFMFGEREWALYEGHDYAIYGRADLIK